MVGGMRMQIVATSASILAVATAAIVVRVWARFGILRTLGLDDVLIIFSWMLANVCGFCIIAATHRGLGSHHDQVRPDDYHHFLTLQVVISNAYSWGIALAKASFAVLYLRIVPGKWWRLLNKTLVVFELCQALEETLVVILRCRPVAKSFFPEMEGSCYDLHPLWYSTFVFNLIADMILFIQPIPSMWKLQLPTVKKIGVIAMLSLGLLVTAISVIRIKTVVTIGDDDTYELREPLLWSEVELYALIICACIPSLRQVAATIPGLSSVLGLSSGRGSRPSHPRSGKRTLSIPLQRRDYIQSQKIRSQSRPRTKSLRQSSPFGMTSYATAGGLERSGNGSEEEIFPHGMDQHGVIVVTHEVIRDVVRNGESPASHTDASLQDQEEEGRRKSEDIVTATSSPELGENGRW
ncbi:hypothetical protein F4780DRAFT_779491 [Xylariomycetidae sp. FL0641]|nr:hypothetical protein F4780DRAFT_779491 [Xylariomycetidae sp. FL0641]